MRQRPIAVTIFGILNIGYALWRFGGLVLMKIVQHIKLPGAEALKALQSDPVYIAWTNVTIPYTVAAGVTLLAAGIGLLLWQNWARMVSIVYAVVDILFILVGAVVSSRFMGPMMESLPGPTAGLSKVIMAFSFVFGIVFNLAYPILLLIFMTRPNVVEACQPEPPQAMPGTAP